MDRRRSRRYAIECPVRFRLLEGRDAGTTGSGTTVNMASGGLLLTTDRQVPEGVLVELAVDWPAKLDCRTRLKLVLHGAVVRSEPGKLAVRIRKHDFRLAGLSGEGGGPPSPAAR